MSENSEAAIQMVCTVGNREAVYYGRAKRTGGGLTKDDLVLNGQGKIVSRKASEAAARRYAKTGGPQKLAAGPQFAPPPPPSASAPASAPASQPGMLTDEELDEILSDPGATTSDKEMDDLIDSLEDEASAQHAAGLVGGGVVGGSLSVGRGVRKALKRAHIREGIGSIRANAFALQQHGDALFSPQMKERIAAIATHAHELFKENLHQRRAEAAHIEALQAPEEVGGRLSVGKGALRALKRAQIREAIAAQQHNAFELQMGGSLSVGKGARRALKRAQIREGIAALQHDAFELQMGRKRE